MSDVTPHVPDAARDTERNTGQQIGRNRPQPMLSVIVPSVNGWSDLDACLSALEQAESCTHTPLELLVPERCGTDVRTRLAARYPLARVLPVSASTTIPQMRALAIDAATAPTVAVIEDHVIVPERWAQQLVEARCGDVRAVGGALVNAATANTVDWAAFLCEYSHVLTPRPAGPVEWLMGNNTAYDRALLQDCHQVVHAGRWEHVLHNELRRRGITLWNRPDIVVAHKKHYTVGEYTTQRFLYARAYAADRTQSSSTVSRVSYGAASLALPVWLYARITSRVWRSGAHRRELWQSLPLLALFVTAWGLGEVIGAWFGDGGAMARVC
ncbi:glycosyltransferase family 2 protein [Gemmatimonas sp.]|uniref:glycosyltransferase family 2 protein n=1 Tax=Gemmatimonas sp. TaxID=1962908 RepID=UPI003983B2F7